jgi:hypothetical protein
VLRAQKSSCSILHGAKRILQHSFCIGH